MWYFIQLLCCCYISQEQKIEEFLGYELYDYLISRSWFSQTCRDDLETLIDYGTREEHNDFFRDAWGNALTGDFPDYVKQFI
jgi:hypothetical protein